MRLRDAQKIVTDLVGTATIFIAQELWYRDRKWIPEWRITWFAWGSNTGEYGGCQAVRADTLNGAVEKLQALALERRQQQIDEAGSELQGDQERAGIACGERGADGRLT